MNTKSKETAKRIGEIFLAKFNGDYDKTADFICRLMISEIIVTELQVIIKTGRPGLLIGKRGENMDLLQTMLGLPIHIIEDENCITDWMIPRPDDEDIYPLPTSDGYYDSGY